jgi:carbamoyl-phosphate synthase small subunit
VATVSHVCLNDDVVEGLELRSPEGELRSFSVQYHPEAAAGPHDAAYLFDRFLSLMESQRGTSGATEATNQHSQLMSSTTEGDA